MPGSKSKIALVTDAGTGIGRAVTITLLQNGYAVALTGRRQGPLEETAHNLRIHIRCLCGPGLVHTSLDLHNIGI